MGKLLISVAVQQAYQASKDFKEGDKVTLLDAKHLDELCEEDCGTLVFERHPGATLIVGNALPNGRLNIGPTGDTFHYNVAPFCVELTKFKYNPKKVGGETISKITSNTVTVGCTTAKFSEVEAVYKAMKERKKKANKGA